MTKEEKIKEVIARDYLFRWVHETGAKWAKMPEAVQLGYYKRAQELIKYLKEQGLRFPEEGEPLIKEGE